MSVVDNYIRIVHRRGHLAERGASEGTPDILAVVLHTGPGDKLADRADSHTDQVVRPDHRI